MLIILSGPPAAGKSSVGEALANKFSKSVYFSADTIRRFVKGGYVRPWEDADEIGQSTLATAATQDIAKRYTDKGYVVIIDDVLEDATLQSYKEKFSDVYAFLLLPSLAVLKQRDLLREPKDQMGSRVDELHNDLSKKEYKLLEVIDSSNQTLEETTNHIFQRLNL